MTSRKEKALAAAKAAAALARRREAIAAYRALVPFVRRLRRRGLSYDRIAAELNAAGHRTVRGQPFHGMQIWNILDRAEGAGAAGQKGGAR